MENKTVAVGNTQVIISNLFSDSFIIGKRFGRSVSIITPFVEVEKGVYDSDFVVKEDSLYRIQNLFNLTRAISQYTISADRVSYNGVKDFPEECFTPGVTRGWLHYNHTAISNEDEPVVNQIDDRICFEAIDDEEIDNASNLEMEFQNKSKINFNYQNLKVFPIVCSRGFILVVANRHTATMYTTVLDCGKMYVGNCNQGEVSNLLQNVFSVFPFFNVNVSEKGANIFLKNIPGLRMFLSKTELTKAIVRFQYSFKTPDTFTARVMGR